MATSKRRKAPARWLLLGLSGLATAGFLGAILNGPGPSQASSVPASAQAATELEAQAPPALNTQPGDQSFSGLDSPPAQAQIVTSPPRFRSRGS